MIGVNNTDKKLRSISNWSSKQLMNIYNNRVMDDDEHSIIKKAKVKKGTGSISILVFRHWWYCPRWFCSKQDKTQKVKKGETILHSWFKVCEDVFYSVKITVSNKQYITQNIETENFTIKLKNNNNNADADVSQDIPHVIQCNNVEVRYREFFAASNKAIIACIVSLICIFLVKPAQMYLFRQQ